MTVKSKLLICIFSLFILSSLICGLSFYRLYLYYGEMVSAHLGTTASDKIWMTAIATIALLLLLMIAVMIIIAVLLIKSVLTPLSGLYRMANEIKEGNLDFREPYYKRDEIGRVYEEFNEMRERLKRALEEQSEHERSRKEMIGNIAHDIKTPVTSILGHAEGLLDGVANTPEKQEKYLRTIMQKAQVVDTLVTDLYLFSKLDLAQLPFECERIPLKDYLESVFEELLLQQKNMTADLTFQIRESAAIFVDGIQLRRVLQNITENSIKYAGGNGVTLDVLVYESNEQLIVRISDDGPGVTEEECEKIFDRFFRSDQARGNQGSGLGLSICKQIVESMQGRIWARCIQGKGLSIYISFPYAEQDERNI